jgi:hypothetical protein
VQRVEGAMILLPADGDAAPAPLLPNAPVPRSERSGRETLDHLNIRLKVLQWKKMTSWRVRSTEE